MNHTVTLLQSGGQCGLAGGDARAARGNNGEREPVKTQRRPF